MRLELSPLAETDLEAIGDYIAVDSPGNALRFIQELRDQCRKITKAPMAYVARLELGDGLRSCAHGRYVIFSGLVMRSSALSASCIAHWISGRN
jgi:toxin ParE1/3/4